LLVLTRKANQSIMIGDGVEVSVLAIMGEKVRIGIAAPRSVPVFRKEVYVQIKRERGEPLEGPGVDEALDDLERSKAKRRLPTGGAPGVLAGQQRESLEHHDRHNHGGREQREGQ
jgi:carbon storage regulator